MKWNHKLSLIMIAGIAIILPMSAFGEDQKQDGKAKGKKDGGSQKNGGKVAQQGQTVTQSQTRHASQGSAKVQQPVVSTETSRSSEPVNRAGRKHRSQSQVYSAQQRTQVYSTQQQYTRSNRYGGLWFDGNTHSDWNRNDQHYWNHHNYRWYDGGWLIIDGGYTPYYPEAGYSNRGSTVSNVQMRLADQGYYRGPIDGDAGPGTRNAIAQYQGDNGMRVTGRINDSLLLALRLE